MTSEWWKNTLIPIFNNKKICT